MANTLSGRTWEITTTGVCTTDPVKIRTIEAKGTLVIKNNDASAKTLFDTATAGAHSDVCLWSLNGFQVTTAGANAYLFLE